MRAETRKSERALRSRRRKVNAAAAMANDYGNPDLDSGSEDDDMDSDELPFGICNELDF